MSYIRCYELSRESDDGDQALKSLSEGDGDLKSFLRYNDVFVKSVRRIADAMLNSPESNLQNVIDPEKWREKFKRISSYRVKLVKEVAVQFLLQREEKATINFVGSPEFFSSEEFTRSMHPMGVFMEEALKGARGETAARANCAIDDRNWHLPRRFILECPEQPIYIYHQDLEKDISDMVRQSRRSLSFGDLVDTVFEKPGDTASSAALQLLETRLKQEARSHNDMKKKVGRIVPCVIEVVTSRHVGQEVKSGLSAAKREQEEEDAKSLLKAIYKKVEVNVERANWRDRSIKAFLVTVE